MARTNRDSDPACFLKYHLLLLFGNSLQMVPFILIYHHKGAQRNTWQSNTPFNTPLAQRSGPLHMC